MLAISGRHPVETDDIEYVWSSKPYYISRGV
jgi:hypothetical protein